GVKQVFGERHDNGFRIFMADKLRLAMTSQLYVGNHSDGNILREILEKVDLSRLHTLSLHIMQDLETVATAFAKLPTPTHNLQKLNLTGLLSKDSESHFLSLFTSLRDAPLRTLTLSLPHPNPKENPKATWRFPSTWPTLRTVHLGRKDAFDHLFLSNLQEAAPNLESVRTITYEWDVTTLAQSTLRTITFGPHITTQTLHLPTTTWSNLTKLAISGEYLERLVDHLGTNKPVLPALQYLFMIGGDMQYLEDVMQKSGGRDVGFPSLSYLHLRFSICDLEGLIRCLNTYLMGLDIFVGYFAEPPYEEMAARGGWNPLEGVREWEGAIRGRCKVGKIKIVVCDVPERYGVEEVAVGDVEAEVEV
ncbi:hypothetical protein HK097_001290, partial [Rhizophlyctis rosea]